MFRFFFFFGAKILSSPTIVRTWVVRDLVWRSNCLLGMEMISVELVKGALTRSTLVVAGSKLST